LFWRHSDKRFQKEIEMELMVLGRVSEETKGAGQESVSESVKNVIDGRDPFTTDEQSIL